MPTNKFQRVPSGIWHATCAKLSRQKHDCPDRVGNGTCPFSVIASRSKRSFSLAFRNWSRSSLTSCTIASSSDTLEMCNSNSSRSCSFSSFNSPFEASTFRALSCSSSFFVSSCQPTHALSWYDESTNPPKHHIMRIVSAALPRDTRECSCS